MQEKKNSSTATVQRDAWEMNYVQSKDKKQVMPGYWHAHNESSEYFSRIELLLPVDLIEKFRRAAEFKAAAVKALPENLANNASREPSIIEAAERDSCNEIESETPSDDPSPLEGVFADRPSVFTQIHKPQDLLEVTNKIQKTSKSDRPRLEEIERRLKQLGTWRHRLYPLIQGQMEVLDAMQEQYPHFASVINIYRRSAKAGAARGVPMAPPPILMLGVPGLGKTHFAQALAKCMGLPYLKLGYDSGLTNSELLGTDKHWANTHHGQLFEHLCLGQIANPLFFLDELDKAALHYGSKGQSALSSLLSCLEPTSSSAVRDISINVTMNASHVIWLAAANDAELIPQSIRSRFTEVLIRPPVEPKQMYQLNWHICKSVVVDDYGCLMPDSMIRTSLAILSPREQRKHLQAAVDSAAANGRDWLEPVDFPPGIVDTGEDYGQQRGGNHGPSSKTSELLH